MARTAAGALLLVCIAVCAAGCARTDRVYELEGQVVAIDQARQEITIKHGDIPRFMPGMTMAFKVRDARLLDGRAPGDLVKGTLVVEDSDAYLRTLERTGTAPLAEPAPPPRPAVVAPGEAPPDIELVDHHGETRKLSGWHGRVLAVTFIYTRCPLPNFCPLMDSNFRTVQAAVKADAGLRGRVHLLSVSFDPAFDTPPVLAARARTLGADPTTWTFLTGNRDAVDRFAGAFGVSIVREDPRELEIVHNLRTAVLDRDGRLVTILSGNDWTPEQLIAELRKTVAQD